MTTPYTYLIGWTKLNLWYYGVRTAHKCHPSDLFKTYFTSSKKVHNLMFEHGMPDVIQVRKQFVGPDGKYKARLWEATVIRRIDISNKKWINQHSPDEGFFIKGPISDSTRDLMRNAALSLPQIKCEHCGVLSNPGHYKQFHGDRCRSTGFKGTRKPPTQETREKLRISSTGRVVSQETREKHRAHALKQVREHVTCEHCGISTIKTNYKRWHGPKCKLATGTV